MKDFNKIRAPFLTDVYIKKRADDFRKKYWDDDIPIDIEEIIDVGLKINIIPVLDLSSESDMVAFIAANWKDLYVDEKIYNGERSLNRLRFSLAHEIGHSVLHKDLYETFQIETVEEYGNFIQQIPEDQYGFLETQANKFAAALLVPETKLKEERESTLSSVKKALGGFKIDKATKLNSYLAIPLSKKFGISQDSMEICLNNLDKDDCVEDKK